MNDNDFFNIFSKQKESNPFQDIINRCSPKTNFDHLYDADPIRKLNLKSFFSNLFDTPNSNDTLPKPGFTKFNFDNLFNFTPPPPRDGYYEPPEAPLSTPSANDLYELSLRGLPTKSKRSWWVKHPKRAICEINKMHNSTNAVYRCKDNKLIWEEVIENNFGTKFHIKIHSRDYPHRMPETYVKDAEINYKRGMHMFNNGRLCLMEDSAYNSRVSILDIRNLACTWCWAVEVYTHTKKWPTAEAD